MLFPIGISMNKVRAFSFCEETTGMNIYYSKDQLPTLPYEIQICILDYLTFKERILISDVNKSWRSMVLDSPGVWENLSTDDGHDIINQLSAYQSHIHQSWVKNIYVADIFGPQYSTAVI